MRSKAKRIWHTLSVSALTAALCGCMADTRHLAFLPIGHDGWAHDDTLSYTIAPLAGVEHSGLSLLLQTEGYDYTNIALDITVSQDSTLLLHEQRSYLLDHNLPKHGIGRRNDYTLPVGNITLCDTLPTTITLTHHLAQPQLTGIRSIGIRISKPIPKPGEPVWKVKW